MKQAFRLMLALTVLTGLQQANAQVAFAPAVNYVVSVNAASVVAADVNGDGKIDLVCANPANGTLSVLTNNGVGVFGSNATYAVGGICDSVAAADVNGDGKVDLICPVRSQSPNSGMVVVLTNNGSGSFIMASSPVVGNEPFYVTVADIYGDGRLALVVVYGASDMLTVLTNSGNGVFGSNATYRVGSAHLSVLAADVNGDGKVDLICPNWTFPGTLTVLTNNGNGVFGSNATYTVGNEPDSVAAADVNGDGKVDLISANGYDNTLSVLTNDGSGGFVLASTLSVGLDPTWVTAADVNGDGKPDLICANFNDNTLSVLTNDGSGGFSLAVTCVVGEHPRWGVAADVNGDGKVDLVSANAGPAPLISTGGTLSVLLNVPTLAINNSSSGIEVSWPSSWTNWTLQQNLDLTTTNWLASDDISDNGTNKGLNITSPTGNLFFRLLHP